MTGAAWALGALVLYVVISARVGDAFPFSRYSMYASVTRRTDAAVVSVRVGGVETPAARLERFVGLDPEALHPRGYACSQEWVLWEVKRWVAEHLAAEADPDSVPVEIGFRVLRFDGGALSERFVPLASGRAHWRRR